MKNPRINQYALVFSQELERKVIICDIRRDSGTGKRICDCQDMYGNPLSVFPRQLKPVNR